MKIQAKEMLGVINMLGKKSKGKKRSSPMNQPKKYSPKKTSVRRKFEKGSSSTFHENVEDVEKDINMNVTQLNEANTINDEEESEESSESKYDISEERMALSFCDEDDPQFPEFNECANIPSV